MRRDDTVLVEVRVGSEVVHLDVFDVGGLSHRRHLVHRAQKTDKPRVILNAPPVGLEVCAGVDACAGAGTCMRTRREKFWGSARSG